MHATAPPTPTTASTLDLDPFNPTNDDPISPIYPAKKSSFALRNKAKWPSSPLSYQQFGGAANQQPQLELEPVHFDQLQQHVLLAGGSYDQWQDSQSFYTGYHAAPRASADARSSGRRGQSSYRSEPQSPFGFCAAALLTIVPRQPLPPHLLSTFSIFVCHSRSMPEFHGRPLLPGKPMLLVRLIYPLLHLDALCILSQQADF